MFSGAEDGKPFIGAGDRRAYYWEFEIIGEVYDTMYYFGVSSVHIQPSGQDKINWTQQPDTWFIGHNPVSNKWVSVTEGVLTKLEGDQVAHLKPLCRGERVGFLLSLDDGDDGVFCLVQNGVLRMKASKVRSPVQPCVWLGAEDCSVRIHDFAPMPHDLRDTSSQLVAFANLQ